MSTYVEELRGHDMKLSEQGSQTRVRQNCFQRLTSVQCLEQIANICRPLPDHKCLQECIDELLSKNIDKFSFAGSVQKMYSA